MKIECFLHKSNKDAITSNIVFKIFSNNNCGEELEIPCDVNNLCENMPLIFNRIKKRYNNSNNDNEMKDISVVFNFLEDKNITTIRIIKSFILGLTII